MSNTETPNTNTPAATQANFCLPFHLDSNNFRGRLVRLTDVMDDILKRHDYPRAVAHLLGETMLLAITLAGALKYEGIFTLQAKGDGAISDIVADITSDGALRGYATFNRERVETEDPGTDATALLLGKGYLVFTVDQGKDTERYQGLVELSGRTIADCVTHYFRQSEQIATGFAVSCEQQENSNWRGGAIMLQKMPGSTPMPANTGDPVWDEDALRRAMILLGTATPAELLDPTLSGEDMLFRLFHEEKLVADKPYEVRDECRCSRARVERVLRTVPKEELEELKKDGQVHVSCEFCGRAYDFDESDIENLEKVLRMDIAEAKIETIEETISEGEEK